MDARESADVDQLAAGACRDIPVFIACARRVRGKSADRDQALANLTVWLVQVGDLQGLSVLAADLLLRVMELEDR